MITIGRSKIKMQP